jgi:hypothetical protein
MYAINTPIQNNHLYAEISHCLRTNQLWVYSSYSKTVGTTAEPLHIWLGVNIRAFGNLINMISARSSPEYYT